MNVLGIETSCDETAAAVVRDGYDIRSSIVSSQVALHAGYGGVVPELAAREHLRALRPVIDAALHEGGVALAQIDAVAVTNGPGLVPALLIGVACAKGIAATKRCAFLGVNHFLAHIYGAAYQDPALLADPAHYPLLALVVSGGHTALVLVAADGAARIVGTTLDDAAGEAFDKAAKILGLGYPGGPVIDRLARTGDHARFAFPRGLVGGGGRPLDARNRFNFSFSGVKTALLYAVRDRTLEEQELADVVSSYQEAVVDVLVRKTLWAVAEFAAKTVIVCGGVACNSRLRGCMAEAVAASGKALLIAAPKHCTDNAAMVAGIAYHYLRHGLRSGLDVGVSARLAHTLERVPFAPEYQNETLWTTEPRA